MGGAAGLKFVGISGDVRKPGVFEIPMGLPMSEVIFQPGRRHRGRKKVEGVCAFRSVLGISARVAWWTCGWILSRWRAIGSMLGSGAIVVCAEGRCMLDMALNAVKFFRNESCGKCVPCRMGSQKMVDILTGWTHGKGIGARTCC